MYFSIAQMHYTNFVFLVVRSIGKTSQEIEMAVQISKGFPKFSKTLKECNISIIVPVISMSVPVLSLVLSVFHLVVPVMSLPVHVLSLGMILFC